MSANKKRIVFGLLAGAVLINIISLWILSHHLNRTSEFCAKAAEGKPIVHAIEEFRKDTGKYPLSLADLVPKYLPKDPDLSDAPNRKYHGWEYQAILDGKAASYSLRYYMGRGGVEYEPPHWIGNDEGRRSVLLTIE